MTGGAVAVGVGVVPRSDLASAAGLAVDNGVLVDAALKTSAPAIFAAGDVAEHDGRVWGLWPTAVEQAKIAATNATGGSDRYAGSVPVTMLKVSGVDLTSIGRFDPEEGDVVIALEDPIESRYRKLVLRDGRIVGAILLGYTHEAPGVAAAAKNGDDVTPYLDLLRAGGRVVVMTPQEAGFRSDPTHVEFMDFDKVHAVMRGAGLRVERRYSFPLPRFAGAVFKYNEFVTIGHKP
jgi:NAD(P)H-nitrite reductase large subunit